MRSCQLVGIAKQKYSSYDFLLPPGLFQPRGQSVPLFPSVCLLVRCCNRWRGIGHRPPWSQAGLFTGRLRHRLSWSLPAWLGTEGRSRIPHLRHRQPVGTARLGTAFTQGSLPALFRISLRSLPLPSPMNVNSPACNFVLVQVPVGACAAGRLSTQHVLSQDIFPRRSSGAQLAVGR